ncbi:MAG: hypothetical protein JW866_10295 [Ignavibacteriales bacterium]|nr:hypothetical protein [Ignavibacteriales bacterium]
MKILKVIYILFGVCFFLLLVIVALDIFKDDNTASKNQVRKSEIEKVVLKKLDEYGIQENWIDKVYFSNPDFDSLDCVFKIKMPEDVIVPIFLNDLNKEFYKKNVNIISEEKKSITTLKIYSNNILKFQSNLTYDKSIARIKNVIALIVYGIENLSESEREIFLNVAFPVSFILLPSVLSETIVPQIKLADKEYLIIINDDIKDAKYSLASDYEPDMLRKSISNIKQTFRGSTGFLIDEKSKLYNSSFYNFLRDEFKKAEITLKSNSIYITLPSNDKDELLSIFKFHSYNSDGKKTFYLSTDDLNILLDEIEKYKKKGNLVVLPSQI